MNEEIKYFITYVHRTMGLDKTKTAQDKVIKGNKGLIASMFKLAKRALFVIPIWMLLRGAYMAVAKSITSTLTDWIDLEREMGRVATVTRGTAEDLDNLKNVVFDYTRTSSRSLKEGASALYALGSAGLKVSEQMVGLRHVMNTAIGTFGNVEEIAKLTAGAYNVFGDSLDGVIGKSAKFQKIADILSFTYSVQQVELSEIATAMTYVASIGSLLGIEFETLVGTIGVLNTGMLKGTKAGTSLLNAFAKISQEGGKLRDLGVAFDTSKPLDFLNVIKQLHKIYGDSALSVSNLKEIMTIFGRRGGRAVGQLIKDYDRWTKSLDNSKKSFEDFAEEMREKAENTLPMAFKRLGNVIKTSFVESFSGILEATHIKDFLTTIADTAELSDKLKKVRHLIPERYDIYSEKAKYFGSTMDLKSKEETKDWLNTTQILFEIEEEVTKEVKKGKEEKDKIVTVDKILLDLAKQRNNKSITEGEIFIKLKALLKDRLDLNKMDSKTYTAILLKLKKIIDEKGKEVVLEGKLGKEQEKTLDKIRRQHEYRMMSIEGISKQEISYQKLGDMIRNMNVDLSAIGTNNININDVLSGNYRDIENALIRLKDRHTEIEGILKEKNKLVQLMYEDLNKYSENLKSSFKDAFSEFLTGGSTIEDVFKKTGAAWKKGMADAFSEGITENIFQKTGIKDMFGGLTSSLRYAGQGMAGKMKQGYNYHAKLLRQIFQEHAGSLKGRGAAYTGSLGTTLGPVNAFGGQYPVNYMGAGGPAASYPGGTDYVSMAGASPTGKPYADPKTQGATTRGIGGTVVGGAMMGYSQYQSAEAGGLSTGAAVGSGLMTGIGGAMVAAALLSNPIGWAILGIGALLMAGGITLGSSGKAGSQESVKEQTNQISSRIDISNRELEWVNRNIISMKNELSYIMEKSFYFRERDEDEEFAIGSMRGGN